METEKVDSSCLVLLLVLGQCFIIPAHAYVWMSPSSVCESSHTIAPANGSAPALPTLPSQYSMKVEANILQKAKSVEVEEHFDSVNQRASVSITRNGTTIVSIFNFKTSQRYDIYPNGTCNTRPTGIDYFGFVKERENKPIMATVNDVFRFGTGFNMTYVGKEIVRGISVNHWTSCQNWTRFGAHFQLDYYFSDPDFATATGMSEIPVRAVLNGSVTNMSGPAIGRHTFHHSYEFISFRSGAILNEEVFQIPPGIVCSGRTDNRPLPIIPDQLEMSMEVIVPGLMKRPWEDYLVYDYNHNLAETFITMVVTEDMNFEKVRKGEVKADNDNLIAITASVVRDYNSGLIYITEMLNMTCTIRKMSSSPSNQTMSHGQNLFAVTRGNNKFMYQGQATVRNMLVDMWAIEEGGMSTELYFLPQVGSHPFQPMIGMFIKNRTVVDELDMPKIFQEFIQTEGLPWEEPDNKEALSDQPSKPPPPKLQITGDQLAWGLQLERLIDQYISQKEVNIFHYSPLHLDTKNFQVSHCYKEDEVSHVILIIMADYYKDVLSNYIAFSNSLRNALAQRAGLSLLHISNLASTSYKLDEPNTEATKVTFDLLGAAPVKGYAQKSISQARQQILKAINNGITFHVQYTTNSKVFMVHKSLYILDYDHQSPTDRNSKHLVDGSHVMNDKTSDGSNAKYTPSTVAGIAIGTLLLGVVLGLGAIFLTYRCKHPGEPLVSYSKNSNC